MSKLAKDNLVWLDLEMTGLDPEYDVVIEIATIITDSQLNIIAEGPEIPIHHCAQVLGRMDEWNVNTHTKSGLIERIKKSKVTMEMAETQTLDFIKQYVPERTSPMCGNSIHNDRVFLCNYMPSLEHYFHYRNLDVSTIKELARRWAPEVFAGFKKKEVHLALLDVKESIGELKHYREHFFDKKFLPE